MARSKKEILAEQKRVQAALLVADRKMTKAVRAFFEGSKIGREVEIKALGHVLRELSQLQKSWKPLIKAFLLDKGVPKDTLPSMLPKYRARFTREVLPHIIALQNLAKDLLAVEAQLKATGQPADLPRPGWEHGRGGENGSCAVLRNLR
ncbi:MAG: hypothetical protein AAGC57_08670 [Pseudomonadota bacterium]